MKLKKLVLAALFTALSCVATMVIQIPSATGFINLGDGVVLLSAFFLGPLWGAAAGGLGSMMADLLSGYAHYAPGTLVIKFLMAFAAGLIYKHLFAKLKRSPAALAAGICAEVIMVAGYFFYNALLLGNGIAAAGEIPGNLVQGAFGLVVSLALLGILSDIGSSHSALN